MLLADGIAHARVHTQQSNAAHAADQRALTKQHRLLIPTKKRHAQERGTPTPSQGRNRITEGSKVQTRKRTGSRKKMGHAC